MQLLRLISWFGYLTWQIVLGSWNVMSAAWSPRPFGSPAIVEYRMRAVTDLEIAMFTSAITITPGTLVVGVCAGDDEDPPSVFVHSLFVSDRSSIATGLSELEWHLLHGLRPNGMPREER